MFQPSDNFNSTYTDTFKIFVASGDAPLGIDTIDRVQIVNSITDANIVIDSRTDISKDDIYRYIRGGKLAVTKLSHPLIQHMINGVIFDHWNTVLNLLNNGDVVDKMLQGVETTSLMFRREFVSYLWKMLICNPCPIKNGLTGTAVLVYINFMMTYFYQNLPAIINLTKPIDPVNCMVLIDNRPNILSVFSAIFSMINCKNYQCIIFTSEKAKTFYESFFRSENIVKIKTLEALENERFHIDHYNNILKGTDFWESLTDYDKCVIIQDDGVILRSGIIHFLKYDYIGAPWIDGPGNEELKCICPGLIGNGGLSMRSVEKMIEIVRGFDRDKNDLFFNNIISIPEDAFFASKLSTMQSIIPDVRTASFFSSEEIMNPHSIGFHKVWAYHSPLDTKAFFDTFISQ
jgi:hypothetical protein